jgi:hypothetical protein
MFGPMAYPIRTPSTTTHTCQTDQPAQQGRWPQCHGAPSSVGLCRAILIGMDRWLRTAGSVLINILLAIFGTTLIEHPFSLMITVHTIPEILQRTYLLIVVCGCLLGYFVYRIWQPGTARWLWVVGIGWIVLGAMLLLPAENTSVLFRAQHVSLWSALSGTGCSAGVNAVGCRNWINFTVPALRMLAYSAGAILCSRLKHTGSLPILDAWLGRFRPLKVQPTRNTSEHEQDR